MKSSSSKDILCFVAINIGEINKVTTSSPSYHFKLIDFMVNVVNFSETLFYIKRKTRKSYSPVNSVPPMFGCMNSR